MSDEEKEAGPMPSAAPDEQGEVECCDCGADIQYDATRARDKQRCDHCEDVGGIGWAVPKGAP